MELIAASAILISTSLVFGTDGKAVVAESVGILPVKKKSEGNNLSEKIVSQKLKSIKISQIVFKDVTISAAIQYLCEQSKQLDPEGIGVNILLRLAPEDMKNEAAVNMALTDKTLGETINLLCMLTNLKFSVTKDGVIIASKNAPQ